MSTTIDQAFVTQFESEVHLAFQRMGSKLRGTVRTKTGVKGSTARFQKLGTGTSGTKSRHGDVPIMNLTHSYIDVTLADYYAGEYIDKLDELKINHDERGIVAQSAAAAMGRRVDSLLTTALDATTNANNVSTAATWTSAAAPLALMEAFGNADVPVGDGNCFQIIHWACWSDLMQIEEFSNADYVGPDERPYLGAQAKQWIGFLWMPFTGLPVDGSSDAKQFAYHRTCVGHAIGQDISTDITWQGTKQAHLIVQSLSQGAALIDSTGIIEHVYDV
jgi:Phage capsid protein